MDEVLVLRSQIARCRRSGLGPGQRYSATVVSGVRRFAERRLAQGVSLGAVSAELGLDRGTVKRWTGRGRIVGSKALRRVEIVGPAGASPAREYGLDSGNVVVRTPGGIAIEGVGLPGAARLAAWLDRELR